jgi:hypothetical protein
MSEQENKKQINTMHINMAEFKKDLEYIKDSAQKANKRNDVEHAELKQMIKDFIESADEKYANKWIEKVTIGLLISFLGGLALAVIKSTM